MVRKLGEAVDLPPLWGDLGTVSRGAESKVELVLGMKRRRVVPFLGESPGVERREGD